MTARRPGSPLAVALTAGVTLALGVLTTVAFRPGTSAGTRAPQGAELFRAKGCVACHDAEGSSSRFHIGPSLVTLDEVAGVRVEGLGAEAYVRQSILAPGAFTV